MSPPAQPPPAGGEKNLCSRYHAMQVHVFRDRQALQQRSPERPSEEEEDPQESAATEEGAGGRLGSAAVEPEPDDAGERQQREHRQASVIEQLAEEQLGERPTRAVR